MHEEQFQATPYGLFSEMFRAMLARTGSDAAAEDWRRRTLRLAVRENQEGDANLDKIDFNKLPAPMLLGMPVINSAIDSAALWPRNELEIKPQEFECGLASNKSLTVEGSKHQGDKHVS